MGQQVLEILESMVLDLDIDRLFVRSGGELKPLALGSINSVDWVAGANACSAQESPQPSLPPGPEEAQER